jgi:hypothetical protein
MIFSQKEDSNIGPTSKTSIQNKIKEGRLNSILNML